MLIQNSTNYISDTKTVRSYIHKNRIAWHHCVFYRKKVFVVCNALLVATKFNFLHEHSGLLYLVSNCNGSYLLLNLSNDLGIFAHYTLERVHGVVRWHPSWETPAHPNPGRHPGCLIQTWNGHVSNFLGFTVFNKKQTTQTLKNAQKQETDHGKITHTLRIQIAQGVYGSHA